jgi:hypothetical protein
LAVVLTKSASEVSFATTRCSRNQNILVKVKPFTLC